MRISSNYMISCIAIILAVSCALNSVLALIFNEVAKGGVFAAVSISFALIALATR